MILKHLTHLITPIFLSLRFKQLVPLCHWPSTWTWIHRSGLVTFYGNIQPHYFFIVKENNLLLSFVPSFHSIHLAYLDRDGRVLLMSAEPGLDLSSSSEDFLR